MALKLAVSSFAWQPDRANEAIAHLASTGVVKGVELVLPMAFKDPTKVARPERAACRAAWEEQGLSVISVQSLAYGRPELQLLGDADVRTAFIDHLVLMAELARDLGAQRMVFGSPANRKRGALAMPEAMVRAQDFFRRLGDRIAHTGVIVCLEPNPPIYAGCDFVQRAEEAIELVERIDHPYVATQLDTGAIVFAQREGQGPDDAALKRVVDSAAHMHISVPGLLPIVVNDQEQAALAERLPVATLPWVSIEMKHPAEGADPFPAIDAAISAVRQWYPIEA